MSTLFLRTLRDDPADAEVASHKLLVRAGYIRRVAPGVYTWLPLGLKVVREVERVVREEMNAIGAQEILLPALLPREPYEVTGRWTEYGPTLFRFTDRKGADMMLGPTHEELFALLVKSEFNSYKDLPVTLYQVQTKYRDEERPRAGLLRGREFVMKDSYSFDLDEAGAQLSYQAHRSAYQRIFDRLHVDYAICAATSGAMGGSASEEFLAISAAGEDTFVRSSTSDYAANVEAVVTVPGVIQDISQQPEARKLSTPGASTIDQLVSWAQDTMPKDIGAEDISAKDTLKNIVCKVRVPGGEWELLAVGIPGDRELDEKRLEASLAPAEFSMIDAADFAKYPFLVRGFIGPKALLANGVRYLVDPRVAEGTRWISGADELDHHYVDLVVGRDFTPDGTVEAAEVRDGDPAPDGQGTLITERGIEIGHIFALGTKYTDAFDVDVLGENGKPVRLIQGSYGIGVSRLVAVIAEQHHDEKGLRWPAEISPYAVHVVIANKDEAARLGAESIVAQLDSHKMDVLFDDRNASPGVKFKDAELLGIPYVVIFGRGWANGVVEVRNRFTGDVVEVPVDKLINYLLELSRQD